MCVDQSMQLAEFAAAEAGVPREGDWLNPEFGVTLALLDMDVHRLLAFIREEEKPVAADSEYRGHDGIYEADKSVTIRALKGSNLRQTISTRAQSVARQNATFQYDSARCFSRPVQVAGARFSTGLRAS